MAQNKPKRVSLLEVRKIDTKNGKKSVVQFAKGVKITWDGKEVDLGQYGTLFVKQKDELVNDLDFLLEKEFITAEQHEERLARLDDKQVTAAVQAPLK